MPNQIFGRTDPTPFSRLDSESTSTQKDLETLLRLSSRSGDPHYRERNAYLNAAEDVQLDRIAGALWKQPLTDEVRAKACERLTDVLGREDMSLYMCEWIQKLRLRVLNYYTVDIVELTSNPDINLGMPQECEPRLRELWDMDTGRLFRIEIIEKLLDDYVNEDKYNSVECTYSISEIPLQTDLHPEAIY
jgi:hypothetical protein